MPSFTWYAIIRYNIIRMLSHVPFPRIRPQVTGSQRLQGNSTHTVLAGLIFSIKGYCTIYQALSRENDKRGVKISPRQSKLIYNGSRQSRTQPWLHITSKESNCAQLYKNNQKQSDSLSAMVKGTAAP